MRVGEVQASALFRSAQARHHCPAGVRAPKGKRLTRRVLEGLRTALSVAIAGFTADGSGDASLADQVEIENAREWVISELRKKGANK